MEPSEEEGEEEAVLGKFNMPLFYITKRHLVDPIH
jgi:hypothetical protein